MKKLTKEDAAAFHCPRWDELPTIKLYMDQVTLFIEESIGIFADEKERVVTKTMINNYVKQKIISAPEKKKYDRKHIAMLIVLSILKKVLSMQEIDEVLALIIRDYGAEAAYNLFCERLEANLANAFVNESGMLIDGVSRGNKADEIMNAALAAFTGKVIVQGVIGE